MPTTVYAVVLTFSEYSYYYYYYDTDFQSFFSCRWSPVRVDPSDISRSSNICILEIKTSLSKLLISSKAHVVIFWLNAGIWIKRCNIGCLDTNAIYPCHPIVWWDWYMIIIRMIYIYMCVCVRVCVCVFASYTKQPTSLIYYGVQTTNHALAKNNKWMIFDWWIRDSHITKKYSMFANQISRRNRGAKSHNSHQFTKIPTLGRSLSPSNGLNYRHVEWTFVDIGFDIHFCAVLKIGFLPNNSENQESESIFALGSLVLTTF